MKHKDKWIATKYQDHRGRLRGSRCKDDVHVSSRLTADRIAAGYQAMIPKHVRGDLLDLGCGLVPLFRSYEPLVTSVTCVDWPGSCHDIQHADILCDINQPLPIPSDSFDTVILSDVLEHLHSPDVTIGEVCRLLRPGGKALLSIPFLYGIHEQPHDYHRYTKHAIEHLANRHGLNVIDLQELGGAGDVLCTLLAKLFAAVPVVGESTSVALQWSWELFRQVPVIRRLDDRSSEQFPLEYLAVLESQSRDRSAS